MSHCGFRPVTAHAGTTRGSSSKNNTLSYRLAVWTALGLSLATGGVAHAAIYRYVTPDGVTTFTNVRPTGRYEVIMKDPPAAAAPTVTAGRPAGEVRGYAGVTRARYAKQIQAAAQATRVDPALIHAVISAESGYNPSARSRAGAVGLMQLMPETAARYSVTNRLDPEQSIHGGTSYLRDLLAMFNNDLRLTLAAYNAGENAVVKYGNRIPPYRETVAYVPRVLAYYRKYRANS